MHPDPGRRPTAAGLRDLLLAAIAEPAVAAAPGWAPEAAPAPRRSRARLRRAAATRTARSRGRDPVASAAVWTLTAFPMYPPSWTLPIAVLLAALAWRRPRRRRDSPAAVLAVPAFWNFAAGRRARVDRARRRLGMDDRRTRRRPRALLVAARAPGRSALIGLGPAFVIVAATAPTRARRAAEAAAGAVVAGDLRRLGGGPRVPRPCRGEQPARIRRVIARDPALVATGSPRWWLFAVLLASAWRAERRVQALTLWGLGFGLCGRGHSAAPHRRRGRLGAEVAAVLTGYNPRRLGSRRTRSEARQLTRQSPSRLPTVERLSRHRT